MTLVNLLMVMVMALVQKWLNMQTFEELACSSTN